VIPPGVAAVVVLALAGVAGATIAIVWIRRLAGWLPRRALVFHVAAGPCMVLGTIPALLAWWAWRARVEDPVPGPGSAASGGVAWEVVILAGVGGLLWLGGLRCLLEGHRLLRSESPRSGGGR
jgi:hypothetical protein